MGQSFDGVTAQVGLPRNITPWTPHHHLTGVRPRKRYLDCLQIAYWAWRKVNSCGTVEGGPNDVPSWFCDYTQGCQRTPWGPVPHSINQHSKIYSFQLDRVMDLEDLPPRVFVCK